MAWARSDKDSWVRDWPWCVKFLWWGDTFLGRWKGWVWGKDMRFIRWCTKLCWFHSSLANLNNTLVEKREEIRLCRTRALKLQISPVYPLRWQAIFAYCVRSYTKFLKDREWKMTVLVPKIASLPPILQPLQWSLTKSVVCFLVHPTGTPYFEVLGQVR